MKVILLLFAFLMVGAPSAEAAAPCKLPLYIEASHDAAPGTTDNTVNLFFYGLKAAVTLRQGCIVDKMADAHLGLYFTTVRLINDAGGSSASVVAVTLAVPFNGVPVYMDDYVLVIRDTDSVDGQVNALLESIGQTLDRHSSHD